jgi:type VI secretion system protein ImpA
MEIADLLAPIPGENAAGVDLRFGPYDPAYDKIKEARREEPDGPRGPGDAPRKMADWPLVIRLVEGALTNRSKDLQLAAWLTEALLHRDGFSGLRSGLGLMRALLEQYWDTLYPQLEDGDSAMRAAPLDWTCRNLRIPVLLAPINALGHSFAQYNESQRVPTEAEAAADREKRALRQSELAEGRLDPDAFEEAFGKTGKAWYKALVSDIDSSLAELTLLADFAKGRFVDDAVRYSELRDPLEEIRLTARKLLGRKLELEPDPVAATDAGTENSELIAAVSSAGNGGLPQKPVNRADAESRVAAAARYLRGETPTEPASHLMLRGFRWGELRANGATPDPKLLAAPPTDVRTRLKTLLLDGQWSALLEAAEDVMAMPYGRGWLDLQRYVLTACAHLGPEFDAVAAGIRSALAALLREFPALPELTLMDDSPTANAETCAWLAAEGFIGERSARADIVEEKPRSVTAGSERALAARPYARALEKVRAGQPDKAVELLMRAAAQENSVRERFLRRAEAARVMVDSGLDAVALPILEDLIAEIDQHHLDDWEAGELIAQPLALMYRCLGRVNGDSSLRDKLYVRICRLDPMQAIQLKSAGVDSASVSAEA